MNDRELDELLAPSPEIDPALIARISASMADLAPIRAIAPARTLALALFLMSALFATASGYLFGRSGFEKLSAAQLGAIFPALAIFVWLAALLSVYQMTPGCRSWNPAVTLLAVCAAWLALDAILFQDYSVDNFLPQGMACLGAGLVVAIPVAIGAWLILRRGFAVNSFRAGLAAGTLAGLSGLIMLEIHCPDFRAPHIMFWHTAVVPVSALCGALLTRIWRGSSPSSS